MQRRRYAFIVRIWFELEPELERGMPALRGSVQQTDSEQAQYFRAFDELITLLERGTRWRPEGVEPHRSGEIP